MQPRSFQGTNQVRETVEQGTVVYCVGIIPGDHQIARSVALTCATVQVGVREVAIAVLLKPCLYLCGTAGVDCIDQFRHHDTANVVGGDDGGCGYFFASLRALEYGIALSFPAASLSA